MIPVKSIEWVQVCATRWYGHCGEFDFRVKLVGEKWIGVVEVPGAKLTLLECDADAAPVKAACERWMRSLVASVLEGCE